MDARLLAPDALRWHPDKLLAGALRGARPATPSRGRRSDLPRFLTRKRRRHHRRLQGRLMSAADIHSVRLLLMEIRLEHDVVLCRQRARQLAAALGFTP